MLGGSLSFGCGRGREIEYSRFEEYDTVGEAEAGYFKVFTNTIVERKLNRDTICSGEESM